MKLIYSECRWRETLNRYNIGLDVGSTTVKIAVLDEKNNLIHSKYTRHKSDVKKTIVDVLKEYYELFPKGEVTVNVTGSGGLFVEKYLDVKFVQEVIAGTKSIKEFAPNTDVIIELGGEDSKITYLSGNVEQRMNSICAGGTGAFIDQMASLLDTDASGLNKLADDYKKIYPIASRCGVFAKTDIQALMNDGASKEDLAMSVFQSVVNQTISNLACGRPIKGNITFLGGPLHFLPNLKNRFIETLGEERNTFYSPENSQLYVAIGAALLSKEEGEYRDIGDLINVLKEDREVHIDETQIMDPLFTSKKEYEDFVKRHETKDLERERLEEYIGPVYIGIDSGSTTSKMIVLGEENQILYEYYDSNKGRPLEHVIENLRTIYTKMNDKAWIASSGITGYGEDFIKSAMQIDTGEVETIAHYTAAKYFDPKVDFILDIGGQDMKAMHVKNGVIDSIQLNEACSSGCGSFLQTFAQSVGMNVKEFQEEALFAESPVDLGSRCTVFMNSKVKQAQKEGAEVGDIAAGLCYSVILNAIQKVIKVRDPSKLGEHIVVQGGTFYGNGILRTFEKITGKEVTRPVIAGQMGALGMALIAKERSQGKSTIKTKEEIDEFSYKQKSARCGLCTNNCSLQINIFNDGRRYITGNRCERGAGIKTGQNELPNMFKYKYNRTFNYEPLADVQATRGVVGLPRVLNMYENYPFWHTLFTNLGFRVVLSSKSSRDIYDKGIESISSETACFPAKISHGHIEDLIEKGVKFIWYPSVFYENKQFDKADNQLNCPVVAGYPEVIKNNMESLRLNNVTYRHPHISFEDIKKLTKRLVEELGEFEVDGRKITISEEEIKRATEKAWQEQNKYHLDIKNEGKKALEYIKENNKKGIVLCGRPYHVDPEINHGISELITQMGLAVLTEDSIAYNIEDLSADLRVLDQWAYHSRLYRAAEFVGRHDNLELVQLNSFGCGLDAVTTDQVSDILASFGKIYTVLKIDEVSNLGAAKIRIRSLVQAMEDKGEGEIPKISYEEDNIEFTKEMREEGYTILVPAMAPDHFRILQAALESEGYNIDFLDKVDRNVINEGLKYVNNDSCYPSITVVGQFVEAMKSGKYDPNKVAVLMSQTGGACRASNYVGYIRKAFKEAGFSQVPVIAVSAQGIEVHSGMKINIQVAKKGVVSIVMGDAIMRVSNRMRPYELVKGTTDELKEKWLVKCCELVRKFNYVKYKKLIKEMIEEFDNIPIDEEKVVPRVGIVGEILVKYLPEANNHLQEVIESEGGEAVMPDLNDFLLYCVRNSQHKADLYGKSQITAKFIDFARVYIEFYRKPVRSALNESKHFEEPLQIYKIEDYAEEIVSLGHQYGEGWLLTGEMVELIHQGAPNIVCIQPFGCLPNHITGKGVMKAIREEYPESNIIAIDYDPGASEVNQVNRIKLMMTSAWEKIREQEKEKEKTANK